MLDYAHRRAFEVLSLPRSAILASQGPAGILLDEYPCEAAGLELYLLVPQTSDQVFNIENNPAVSLLTPFWKMSGDARVVPFEKLAIQLRQAPEREWSLLVCVRPARIQILGGWGQAETIDLTP